MKKCLLCERKMSDSNNFGKGCLKNMYNIMGIYEPKSIRTEQILNEEILKLCNKKELPEEQNQFLVDRYLTLNILNHVPIPEYDKYKTALQDDVNLITDSIKKKDLKSFNLITLKQSMEVYKMYQKYEETFQKIMNGDYDIEQNIIFDVIRFAFSRYYSKKDYLYDGMQLLQYGILQGGVGLLLVAGCDLSSKLLEHSLKSNPDDVLITEEKYVNKIKENDNFRKKINSIILKYGGNDNFDTGSKKESLTFETGDLKLSIHNAYIQVKGNKNLNSNWNLDIELTDIYDFTDLQELEKYIKGGSYISSTIAATANNLAMIATSCNVVHKYNVTIRFKLKDWKWFNE